MGACLEATTRKRPLTAGDYAVELDGEVVASVERKSLQDLVGTLTSGRGSYLFSALAGLPRAAVVVEERYSKVFDLDRIRPAVVADAIAEAQARFPTVPIIFAETRAKAHGYDVADKGRFRPELVEAYLAARLTPPS